MTAEQLSAACGESHAQGLRAMVHAHAAEAMMLAVEAGCDQIEHGVFATPEVLSRMAAKGTYFSPQCGLVFRNYLENRAKYEGIGNYNAEGFASMERAVPMAVEAVRKAATTPGVKLVFGTDAVAGAHGRNVEDLICRVKEAGQKPMDAITSATSLAAQSMKLGDSIGTLKPGMLADVIAVRGDPLTDFTAMRRVVFVMRDGRGTDVSNSTPLTTMNRDLSANLAKSRTLTMLSRRVHRSLLRSAVVVGEKPGIEPPGRVAGLRRRSPAACGTRRSPTSTATTSAA